MDDEDFEEIVCEEEERASEEAKKPEVLKDPGAPTPREVEEHNVTHLPFQVLVPPLCQRQGTRQTPQTKRRPGREEDPGDSV